MKTFEPVRATVQDILAVKQPEMLNALEQLGKALAALDLVKFDFKIERKGKQLTVTLGPHTVQGMSVKKVMQRLKKLVLEDPILGTAADEALQLLEQQLAAA